MSDTLRARLDESRDAIRKVREEMVERLGEDNKVTAMVYAPHWLALLEKAERCLE